MSEHPAIDWEAYHKFELEHTPLTGDDRERVIQHLLQSEDHPEYSEHDLFPDSMEDTLNANHTNQELKIRYLNDLHAHQAAVLRGEVTAADLWPHRLSILRDSEF